MTETYTLSCSTCYVSRHVREIRTFATRHKISTKIDTLFRGSSTKIFIVVRTDDVGHKIFKHFINALVY